MKRLKTMMAICVATLIAYSNCAITSIAISVPTTLVSSAISSSDVNAKVVVESKTVYAGDTIKVGISLNNNPGISGLSLKIGYDSSVMKITASEAKGLATTFSQTYDDNPYSVMWFDGLKDVDTNGVICELTFKIDENAAPGDYAVTVDYEDGDISDYQDNNIEFERVNGIITLKAPEVAATGLTISPESKNFEKSGETVTIVPTVLPVNATNKNVTYKSSNTSVATVDSDGKVTAVKEGTADITVSTEDGDFKAVCKVTVAHEHKMTEVSAKASTCKVQGNNEYYKCDDCGKYFKDSEGKTETTVEAEKLPLAAHSFTKQDTNSKYLKSAATCTSKAVYYYSCEICGENGTGTFEYGEFDKNNHVGDTEVVGAKAATCDEDGYTGDKVCKSCGEIVEKGKVIPATNHSYSEEWSHDSESHWRECTVGCGTIIDKAAHAGGEATCVKKAVCEVCGTEYGEVDPENHKGETEIRGYVAPTVESEGYTGDTYCLDCGEMIKKGETIPAHVHQLKKVEAVAATHFAAGNIEYYVCDEDGMKFADAEGTKPLTDEEIVVPVVPHSFNDDWKYDESKHWHECECGEKDAEADHTFGDWKVVAAATEDAEGAEERECTVCGAKETKAIKKIDPSSDPSSNDPSSNDSNSSGTGSSEDSSNNSSGNNSKPNTNSSGTSPIANTGGTTNPNTGVATSATALGVLALGAIVVSKRKK
ncbi:Ig-like domain-containing protein [Ruminococcus sp.]|uniref:Ig-like domain-containing protein n=1 Tax=Ruminococcus sp. TaxID=41978 RepID=UPI0025E56475|nr:Ig-like domain-containing protein [Ruminococcus sp.]